MKPKVVIVGSYNQDLVWITPKFPTIGATVIGKFHSGPGGKGTNQAVAAARAGERTVFIGAIGNDEFGNSVPAFFESEDVHHFLATKLNCPTGNAGIWVNENAENQIITALGANQELAPEDVPLDIIRSARVVVCQHETNLAINKFVFKSAKEAGVLSVLNPAPMRSDFDADVLEWVDVLVPNESEFTALVNHLRLFKGRTFLESEIELMSNDDLQALCRRFEVPNVILTLGERGSFVSKRDDYRLIPARKDVEVVDTTGAGDAFVGGFAAGLEEADGNIYSAVEFATTVAGMCVSKRGTARSMPTRDEVFSIF